MKKHLLLAATIPALALLLAFTTPALKISNKHNISFSTFGVSGTFKTFSGNILFDPSKLENSSFNVAIDINSIKTSFALQDKHAKGDDWFDADRYPTIKFISKKIVRNGNEYNAIGDLSLHGITKEISLPFTYVANQKGGLFEGNFIVNRNDFKVGSPGGMVGEEIKVHVEVPVVK